MLHMICNSTALRLVRTSSQGERGEAWQNMLQRHEPRTHQRAANQLVQLLNADLSGELEDKTLSWERMITNYEEQAEKASADYLRVGIWLSNAADSAIKTHMLMRTGLVRWAAFRQEMMSRARARKSSAGLSPTLMGIGAFALGMGKCKCKNGTGVASCEKCGKPGHLADQCLSDHGVHMFEQFRILGCVCHGGPSIGRASEKQFLSYLTIETCASRTVFPRNWAPSVPIFPTMSIKRDDFCLFQRRSWTRVAR